jgi:hypothetical protein
MTARATCKSSTPVLLLPRTDSAPKECWVVVRTGSAECGQRQQMPHAVEAAKGRLHREGVPLGRGRYAAVYLRVVMKDRRGRPEALERAVDAEEELPEELGDGRDALQ